MSYIVGVISSVVHKNRNLKKHLKAQLSFSSGVPLEVTCRANMNSLKMGGRLFLFFLVSNAPIRSIHRDCEKKMLYT